MAIFTFFILTCHVFRAGAAHVFWASDPVKPGQTVMLVGADLAQVASVGVKNDEASFVDAGIVQMTEGSLKFQLPKTLSPGIISYQLLDTDGGLLYESRLNRPAIWWLQGDEGLAAVAGGRLELFGKNLAIMDGHLTLRLSGPKEYRIQAVSGDGYSASALLSEEMPVGRYEIWLEPEVAGSSSEPDAYLDLVLPRQWPRQVFNVQDYGAWGDGIKDDSEGIQQALDVAKQAGGGVVYLPRGIYRVSSTIHIPQRTVLRGEATGLVSLGWSAVDPPPTYFIKGTNSFAVEDLTILGKFHQHIIASDLGNEKDAGNVAVRRVRIRGNRFRGHPDADEVDRLFRRSITLMGSSRGDALRLGGPNVEVIDCDIYGSGRSLYLNGVTGGRVQGCRLMNGRRGWYSLTGCDGLVFADNEVIGADLQASGGGINCLGGEPYSQNVYFARNRLSFMHGWDREAMTSDAGGMGYFGGVTSVDDNVVELSGDISRGRSGWVGAGIFILDGRGRGQHRRIQTIEGKTVTVDRPWEVEPDISSQICITMFQGHYLIIDNSFEDTGIVQSYGCSIENIISGNRGERMAGFSVLGLNYRGYQPSWYCQLLDNRIEEGVYYHWSYPQASSLRIFGDVRQGPYKGVMNLGAVVRDNTLENNSMIRIEGDTRSVVVEDNEIRQTLEGILVDAETSDVWVDRNRFEAVQFPRSDPESRRQLIRSFLAKMYSKDEPSITWNFDSGINDRGVVESGTGFQLFSNSEGRVAVTDEKAVHGKAIWLSGGGFLRLNQSLVFNAPDLTLSFWICPQTVSGRKGLFSMRYGNTGAPLVVSQVDAMLRVAAHDTDGEWSYNYNSKPILKAGEWTHVAVVFQEGQGVQTYIEWKLFASKKVSAPRTVSHSALYIGREAQRTGEPGPAFYEGFLDEVRVWARALEPNEVLDEFERFGALNQ